MTERSISRKTISNFGLAAFLGLLLVLPFAILELVYGQKSKSDFPIGLFGILWILPVILIVTLAPIVKRVLDGNNILANPVTFALRIAVIVLIASLWISLINDQMPCFLGVPNCD